MLVFVLLLISFDFWLLYTLEPLLTLIINLSLFFCTLYRYNQGPKLIHKVRNPIDFNVFHVCKKNNYATASQHRIILLDKFTIDMIDVMEKWYFEIL